MRKDQQEELQRLEEALLEEEQQEQTRQVTDDTTALLLQEIYDILANDPVAQKTDIQTTKAYQPIPETYTSAQKAYRPAPKPRTPAPEDYQVYNTDTTDVAPEEYTEALEEKPKGRGCLWSAIVFVIGALALTVWYLLKILGVSP